MPTLPSHVGIVGLGLMGGSIARDLLDRGVNVIGYDRDACAMSAVRLDSPRQLRLVATAGEVMEAPFVVIAVPVAGAIEVLTALAPHIAHRHTVVDVGSTKAGVMAHAEALGVASRFVGCHPLAGDHRSGWAASHPGVFAGAPLFVCTTSRTDPDASDTACAFWTALGARVRAIDAAAHDEEMAHASHLPHMLSVALALALQDAGIPHEALGPGGRDVTRLAAGSVEMWDDIVVQNRPALLHALAAFERRLDDVRRAVAGGSSATVRALLAEARTWHPG